jgi:16S rRNA (cytidine1402-2'-O)-methyltransferase
VVAFESPQRLPRTLRSLAAAQPERQVAVCRELTKRYEEVVRGTAEELSARYVEPPRGEIVLVLGAAEAVGPDEAAAAEAVAELVRAGLARRQAAELVARLTGASRNVLFERSL